MKKQCTHCGMDMSGRADKRFCSVTCKNTYNNNARKRTRSEVQEIINDGGKRARAIAKEVMSEVREAMKLP